MTRAKEKKKETSLGTIRVEAKSLKAVEKTASGWKRSAQKFPGLLAAVKLYKAEKKFDRLVDTKQPRFLKGQLSPEGREQGARIVVLPNGEKLEKAFSLFSPHLKLHDQTSHDHWDVLYQNKGGTWSYVYTLAKRKAHRARKYKKVDELAKRYAKLVAGVNNALKDSADEMAVPMHTLLHTYMRVGNETYYKAHGHKGLTTLMKQDVSIKGKQVTFSFLGKDGVPLTISKSFPPLYIKRLSGMLAKKKRKDFVFEKEGHLLRETDFSQAFARYCGKEFYPHIIRSHYATTTVKDFLKGKKRVSKDQVEQLYLSIAHELGHKRFNKKTQHWDDHHSVTVKSYIQPSLHEKMLDLIKPETPGQPRK